MPSLLKLCERCFGTTDLYQVLGVRRDAASAAEIRRGYHRVSLRVHPDRVPDAEKEEATRKFQILGRVYSVLSDQEQRAVYDEQGTVDEGDSLSRDRDWEEYWRLLFKKITVEDIKTFEEKYKGSEEELVDVKQAYMDFEGDMDKIMQSVLCAVEMEDEPRIRKIIQHAIDSGEVPVYNAFVKESKKKKDFRKKRAQKEAKEAEKMKADLGLGESSEDLKALIESRKKNREQEMDKLLADLEAKYCKPSKRGSDKKAPISKRNRK